jgi:protein CpxP
MKKQILSMSLLTVLALAGSISGVHADPLAAGIRGDGVRDGSGFGRHQGKMARILDLNETQQQQIQAILEEEREKTAPLRQQMSEYRDQLRQLKQSETFDEAAVRALAGKKAEVSTELMVSRARTHNRIQALLTPDQRERAEKLRPQMHDGRDGKGKRKHRNYDGYSRGADCPNADGRR